MQTKPLTVLLTNIVILGRSGTEVAVEQLADGLRRAGHQPILYTARTGRLAESMRHRGHPVIDRLSALPARPDVIHGHHNMMTMAALAALPGVPAIFVCHDATAMFDAPPLHPRIHRYFVVGWGPTLPARLIAGGVPEDRIALLPNTVDEQRYHPRPALPPRPLRALAIAKAPAHLATLRAACAKAELPLDTLGDAVARISDRLETVLPHYDLVFASGRSALEAAFTGCAVVVCDERGLAGPLTTATLAEWRARNFGGSLLAHEAREMRLADAIAAYDAADATEVGCRLRAEATLGAQVEKLVALYREMVVAEAPADREGDALARFIEDYVPTYNLDRPWRLLAEQIGGADALLPTVEHVRDEVLAGLEARLVASGIGNAVNAVTATVDRMAPAIGRMAAAVDAMAAAQQAADDARAHAEAATRRSLADMRSAIAATATRQGRAEELVRKLYRRTLPRAMRRPVHVLRRRLHSWLEKA